MMVNFPRPALIPPMGWNSFTAFGISVVEDEVKANADYLARHLAPLGWEYVVVDGMWYEDFGRDGTVTDPVLRQPMQVDAVGRLIPATSRFPSATYGDGFAPLARYIHGLGLKFGIHIMRGIARVAVQRNTPIAGTPYHAADIANLNDTCAWYDGMYGVDMTKPGAQEYYNSLIELYTEWGVDYIKADDISAPYAPAEIEALSSAIRRCGRPIVLSLSPGDNRDTCRPEHRKAHCNLWRVTSDLHDGWEQVRASFDVAARWAPHGGRSRWPDLDMLPLGNLHLRRWGAPPDPHMTRLTRDEQRTLMTLWCMARSPLMFAGHLPDNDDWTLSLITNPEVLAVNQQGARPREQYRCGDAIVWTSDAPDMGKRNLAVFNLGDAPLEVAVPFSEIAMPATSTVRDLWELQDVPHPADTITVVIPPHGAGLYLVQAF